MEEVQDLKDEVLSLKEETKELKEMLKELRKKGVCNVDAKQNYSSHLLLMIRIIPMLVHNFDLNFVFNVNNVNRVSGFTSPAVTLTS